MEAVLVEFDVDHNNATECVEALTELMRSFVSKQPKFHSGTIHIEPSTGKVLNYMIWESAADFIAFRDKNLDTIGPAIGRFSPQGRMLEIANRIESDNDA